ncbi:MAG TPA: pilin [Patescibacteria group bacterium]|nr:pilin [Patescibacteria group bacterium]
MFFCSKKILIIIAAIVLFNFLIPFSVFAAEEECPPKDGTIVLQVNIPGVTKGLCPPENAKFYSIIDANGDGKGDMTDFLALIYKFLVGIAGIAAVIMMMVGGYYWLFAGGNASKVGEAKSMISGAVLGLFLALGSYMILNIINPDLVNWKFNPEINEPQIAGFQPVSRLCDNKETMLAAGYAISKKAIVKVTELRCGSTYYPDIVRYEMNDCEKNKDSAACEGLNKQNLYQNGCMIVTCPPDGESLCYIDADKKGELVSGRCIGSIDATVKGQGSKINFDVDDTLGKVCGQADYEMLDEVASICKNSSDLFMDDYQASTCSIVNEKGKNIYYDPKMDYPFLKGVLGAIHGYYKEKEFFMGCFSQHNEFK